MNARFWNNKRVLITGHEGFLGSHLTRKLTSEGARIVGLDTNVRRKHTLFAREEYAQFRTIKGSVVDYALLDRIMKTHRPEIVFHLAAEAIVDSCNSDPLCAFKTNIEGTWNILEAVRRNPGTVRGVVVASSDKAYGSHTALPYTEDTPLRGVHPYDASKSCADLLAKTYYHTYKVPVAVTRCGNIYGPGDFNFSRIIPDAIRCALSDACLMVRSDGKFTRDYVYVDDIVAGYAAIAERFDKGEVSGESFNLSDEHPISVIELLRTIGKVMGDTLQCRVQNTARYEIKHQYLASGKARRTLGWKPKFTLEEGLSATIAWYSEYFLRHRMMSGNTSGRMVQ